MANTTTIIFEDERVIQYADGDMIHKACGKLMTFDGPFLGKHNQYTCFTVGCGKPDRLTAMGQLVPVANAHQDRKDAWLIATQEEREREADEAINVSGLTPEAVERIMSRNRMG